MMAESGKYPLLFSKHLPVELRGKVADASFGGKKEDKVYQTEEGDCQGFRKLSEIKELAVAKVKY